RVLLGGPSRQTYNSTGVVAEYGEYIPILTFPSTLPEALGMAEFGWYISHMAVRLMFVLVGFRLAAAIVIYWIVEATSVIFSPAVFLKETMTVVCSPVSRTL
ncbi:MAG: hypothetical protein QXR13_03555, partial [Candidatus Bathyarchaeia archaeon]